MTIKTSKLDAKVHTNLHYPGINPDIYEEGSTDSDLSEIPEIQETTHQVPCGEYSIFDPAHKVPAFKKAVYLKVNEHSKWDDGVSHALSLRRLSELLNVNSHSQVHRGLQWLIKNGWLKVEGKRKTDGAHFYRIVHHKCKPLDTPVDRDGRPQKCAVPMGKGSPSQLLADRKITWRIFVDWIVRKIKSCWITGVNSMTVREAVKWMKFTPKTVSENAKKMTELGMLDRLSAKFERSEYQMFPKPYPDRRERTPEVCITKKAMKLIKGCYYSYNKWWRFEKETFRLQRLDGGRWIESTLGELYSKNRSIYHDFTEYMHQLSKLHGTPLLT